MATVNIAVYNPTVADITVNAKVAKARQVTTLGLDDTTNESEQFLAGKCALVSVSAQPDLSKRAETGFALEMLSQGLG